MSHKSKKRNAKFFGGWNAPRVMQGPPPDFDEFERREERRAARHEELRYRIAPDCKVHIQFNGIATQEALRKLIDYIEMALVDFPKDAANSPTQD